MNCGECRFFDRVSHESVTEGAYGNCRRRAPADSINAWPQIYVTAWCGEFEAAPLGPRATVAEEINYLATCVDRLATGLMQLLQRP